MLVVKRVLREKGRDNSPRQNKGQTADGEEGWMNCKTATDCGGGPVKRRYKAASKAAENGSLFIRTDSYEI
jgi:hypothetical protein